MQFKYYGFEPRRIWGVKGLELSSSPSSVLPRVYTKEQNPQPAAPTPAAPPPASGEIKRYALIGTGVVVGGVIGYLFWDRLVRAAVVVAMAVVGGVIGHIIDKVVNG